MWANLREAGSSTGFLANPSQFCRHCQQPPPSGDLARAQKKEACGLTKKQNKTKNICVNQPVEGKNGNGKDEAGRRGPVAKMERELPDLAFWMTRGDIARWLPV